MTQKLTSGVEQIAEQRWRQLAAGFDARHDDKAHGEGDLAVAAAGIILDDATVDKFDLDFGYGMVAEFAEALADRVHRKYESRITRLAIAGGLIAAEIDRLNRTLQGH